MRQAYNGLNGSYLLSQHNERYTLLGLAVVSSVAVVPKTRAPLPLDPVVVGERKFDAARGDSQYS